MKRKGFKDSKAFAVGCKMPPRLTHCSGESFDPAKSQVIEWLLSQPEIRTYIFYKFLNAGAIIYDTESGTWKGKDS